MEQIDNATASHPGGAQADDIHVGFVAVMVAMFAAFLLVSLIGLEAVFYNQVDAETEAKTEPQYSPNTPLGKKKIEWDTMLAGKGKVDNILAPQTKDPTTGVMGYPKVDVVPIDTAMKDVIAPYIKKGTK